jgi:hypothetical protein
MSTEIQLDSGTQKYVPVTVLFQINNENIGLDASSGVYLLSNNNNYVISLINERYELANLNVKYTSDELINDKQVKWINIPKECIIIKKFKSDDLNNFFKNCNLENNNKDKFTMVAKLPNYCTIRNHLKEFRMVKSINGYNIPKKIKIESSPFGLTNVDIFNGYTNFGYINYESDEKEFWLSDCKYMNNMNGGIVTISGDYEIESIGLVWGNVKWDGHGELMVVVCWECVIGRSGIFDEPNMDNGVDTDYSYVDEQLPDSETYKSVVSLHVFNNYGVSSWGSGVIIYPGLIVTNKHVITGDVDNNVMPYKIEIRLNDSTDRVIEIRKPVIGLDVKMLFEKGGHDVCFVQCDKISTIREPVVGTSDISVGDLVVSVGHGLFRTYRPLRSVGEVSKIVGDTIVTSAGCWGGSSGGAVFDGQGRFVGIMANNIRVMSSGEVLPRVNLAVRWPTVLAVLRAVGVNQREARL